MRPITRTLWPAFLATAVAGCSLAPAYHVPDAPVPTRFKEADGEGAGTWEPAVPADAAPRDGWWSVFNDPVLEGLEADAAAGNQDVLAAAARVSQARGQLATARADAFPQVGAGVGPTRQLNAPGSLGVPPGTDPAPQTVWRGQVSVSYEVDLFGRVASERHAAHADLERSGALFESVRLALQADVAQAYFSIRELDAELDVLDRTVVLREAAVTFAVHRFDAGDVSELDVAEAKAELETARSDAMTLRRQRAITEHALAVLLGKAPADFALAASPIGPVDVAIPAGLPSALLQRRPDIAAAERAMAAANARIGVARAAFFPSLSLTGTGGFESASLTRLFQWSNRTFLAGPFAGAPLAMSLLDGGRRRGNLDSAKAAWEESVAGYREQVLQAFREVEDGLVSVRTLKDQVGVEGRAVEASARAAHLARVQYDEGQVAYITVIDAERTALLSRRRAVQRLGEQATAHVQLIRALGGGWHAPAPGVQPVAP